MSGQLVCLFCSSVSKSKSEGQRHSVTHLPWYFESIYALYVSKGLKLNKSYLNIVKPKATRENWMLTKLLLMSKVNEDSL